MWCMNKVTNHISYIFIHSRSLSIPFVAFFNNIIIIIKTRNSIIELYITVVCIWRVCDVCGVRTKNFCALFMHSLWFHFLLCYCCALSIYRIAYYRRCYFAISFISNFITYIIIIIVMIIFGCRTIFILFCFVSVVVVICTGLSFSLSLSLSGYNNIFE